MKVRSLITLGFAIFLSVAYLKTISDIFVRASDPFCTEQTSDELNPPEFAYKLLGYSFTVKCSKMALNEIGDYFAGLLALLTTFWLVLAFIWQARELSFQRAEFAESNFLAKGRQENEMLWRLVDGSNSALSELHSNIVLLVKHYEIVSSEPTKHSTDSMSSAMDAFYSLPDVVQIKIKYFNGQNIQDIDSYVQQYSNVERNIMVVNSIVSENPECAKYLSIDISSPAFTERIKSIQISSLQL